MSSSLNFPWFLHSHAPCISQSVPSISGSSFPAHFPFMSPFPSFALHFSCIFLHLPFPSLRFHSLAERGRVWFFLGNQTQDTFFPALRAFLRGNSVGVLEALGRTIRKFMENESQAIFPPPPAPKYFTNHTSRIPKAV